MWDHDRKNIKVYQAAFIDTGPLRGESRFNMETHKVL